MNPGYIIAGLGILSTTIVGGLGLYFSYKARIDAMAGALYGKRIEAYVEISCTFADFHDSCMSFIMHHGNDLDDETLEKFKEATSKSRRRANRTYRKWSLLLTSEMNYAVLKCFNAYHIITKHPEAERITADGNEAPDAVPEQILEEAMFGLFNKAREELGIDALTEQMQELKSNLAGEEKWKLNEQTKKLSRDNLGSI